MVGIALAGDVVFIHAIMWQVANGLLITALAQPVDVKFQDLPDRLVIIENEDALPYKLDNPDRECVGSSATPTDVNKRAERQKRIGGNLANPAIKFSFCQTSRIIGTLESLGVITFPDVIVPLRI